MNAWIEMGNEWYHQNLISISLNIDCSISLHEWEANHDHFYPINGWREKLKRLAIIHEPIHIVALFLVLYRFKKIYDVHE